MKQNNLDIVQILDLNTHIPVRILRAILHVRTFFPEVEMVVFNNLTQWAYMDKDFGAPNFEGVQVNQTILEDAQRTQDNLGIFPAVYQLKLEKE